MSHRAELDPRARLERMALRLAFDADGLEQRGSDASPHEVATLAAAAEELRRARRALAYELGEHDPIVVLAQTVLEGVGRDALPPSADARLGDDFAVALREWRAALRRDTLQAAGAPRRPRATWAVSGSYLEACNCEPMCGCHEARPRRERRPRDGVCAGALSWTIEKGHAKDVDLDGLGIVLAFRHDEATPGAPWDIAVYLDQRADPRQGAALRRLFAGGRGHGALAPFPWAAAAGRQVSVRTAPIEADHRARRPWFDAGDYVSVRLGDPVSDQRPARSLIADHPQAGVERRGTRLRVADERLAFEPGSLRAFESPFSYGSHLAV